MSYYVTIPKHAAERARARFAGEEFDVHAEVNEALADGRISVERPIAAPDLHPGCLYVWTPDRRRIYAIKPDDHTDGSQWAVLTVLRATQTQLERWRA